jgi:Integrase core domain
MPVDNAAAEAFFSTLEHEVLSRHRFTTRAEAREVLVAWCLEFYNVRRRHSSAGLQPPPTRRKPPQTNRSQRNASGRPVPLGDRRTTGGTPSATASRRRVRGLGTQRSAR